MLVDQHSCFQGDPVCFSAFAHWPCVKESSLATAIRSTPWCEKTLTAVRPNPHRTLAHKFECKSFDVACVQCGYSPSHQQVPFVPFAFVAHARPVWMKPQPLLCNNAIFATDMKDTLSYLDCSLQSKRSGMRRPLLLQGDVAMVTTNVFAPAHWTCVQKDFCSSQLYSASVVIPCKKNHRINFVLACLLCTFSRFIFTLYNRASFSASQMCRKTSTKRRTFCALQTKLEFVSVFFFFYL